MRVRGPCPLRFFPDTDNGSRTRFLDEMPDTSHGDRTRGIMRKRVLYISVGVIIVGGVLIWLGYTRLPRVQDRKAYPIWSAAQASEQSGEFARAVSLYRELAREYGHSSFLPKSRASDF